MTGRASLGDPSPEDKMALQAGGHPPRFRCDSGVYGSMETKEGSAEFGHAFWAAVISGATVTSPMRYRKTSTVSNLQLFVAVQVAPRVAIFRIGVDNEAAGHT